MSLEKVKHEVLSEADRQAKAIVDEAERERDRILEEARVKAKAIVAEKEKLGEARAKELGLELRASALLQAKRMESEAKEEVAESVFLEIRRELAEAAGKPAYEKVFDSLARKAIRALGDKQFVLKTNARDKKLGAKHGRVAEAISTAGGLVAAKEDGSVQINSTFEAVLEENEDQLKQKVFEELFPQEKRHAAVAKTHSESSEAEKKASKPAEKAAKKSKKGKGRR